MIDRKEKIKWRGDLKETTGLILGQVSSLKKETGLNINNYNMDLRHTRTRTPTHPYIYT